jgi:hypothetical protein
MSIDAAIEAAREAEPDAAAIEAARAVLARAALAARGVPSGGGYLTPTASVALTPKGEKGNPHRPGTIDAEKFDRAVAAGLSAAGVDWMALRAAGLDSGYIRTLTGRGAAIVRN